MRHRSSLWHCRPGPLAIVLVLLILTANSHAVLAQNQTNNRDVSPQERQANALRQTLGVTDDGEWNALSPKIMKVQTLVRQLRDLRELRRADRLRRQSDSNSVIPPVLVELADRAAELRQIYNDPNTPAAYIQRTLKVYREVRAKAEKQLTEDLATARSQLRDLVTARQELTLIMAGLLD